MSHLGGFGTRPETAISAIKISRTPIRIEPKHVVNLVQDGMRLGRGLLVERELPYGVGKIVLR